MVKFTVFISHTNGASDMTVVKEMASQLKKIGVHPYIAEEDRVPGSNLAEKIKNNINICDMAIGLWTKNATNSKYVNQELGYFEGSGKPYFLFVENGVKPSGFAEGLEHIPFDSKDPAIGLNYVTDYMNKMKCDKENKEYWVMAIGIAVIILDVITSFLLLSRKKTDG